MIREDPNDLGTVKGFNRQDTGFSDPRITSHDPRGKGNPFDRDLPLFDAEISRGGDIRTSPTWSIKTNGRLVVATWSQIQPPVITEGPAPTFREDLDFFTVLFFCDTASIELDGAPVPGRPYPRDIWRKSIGGDRSSCVFALSETSIRISVSK